MNDYKVEMTLRAGSLDEALQLAYLMLAREDGLEFDVTDISVSPDSGAGYAFGEIL